MTEMEPRFLTAWEHEDYERQKRGEQALGPFGYPRQSKPPINEAAIDVIAKAIYETMPETDGGEHLDGFRVSPAGDLSWNQIVECGDHAVEPYRKAARAAMAAMREMTD